jgi:hypothetical protein
VVLPPRLRTPPVPPAAPELVKLAFQRSQLLLLRRAPLV